MSVLAQGLLKAQTESDIRTQPSMIYFYQIFVYQNNCKEAINLGEGQIRGALFKYLFLPFTL